MLFSSNHLLEFDSSLGAYDIEAVFNRIIFFPYQNKPIDNNEENKHLSDELYEERDAIFTWAMKGLRQYIENKENFPECKASKELKQQNMAKFCPEKTFFEKYMIREADAYESSSLIKEVFKYFCEKTGVSSKGNILRYLDEHERLKKMKKRIDEDGNPISEGNPIHVYEGVRLKRKYRIDIN